MTQKEKQYTADLESQVEELQEALAVAVGRFKDDYSRVEVCCVGSLRRLPVNDSDYVFKVSEHKEIRVGLRQEGGQVYLDLNSSSRMPINPRAANAAWILMDGEK